MKHLTATLLGRTRAAAILLLAVVAVLFLLGFKALADPAAEPAQENLLKNGDLARGSGNSCDGWRTDAWILSPDASKFTWIPPKDGDPGQLEVENLNENDARWVQSVWLSGGWYHIGVWVRTEDVLPIGLGANISILDNGVVGGRVNGTVPWRPLDLWVKIPPQGANIDVALRLGGPLNTSRGKAFFSNPRITRLRNGPPLLAFQRYDLGAIRKTEGPIGETWTLYVTYLMLALVAVIGWRMFMLERGRNGSKKRLNF